MAFATSYNHLTVSVIRNPVNRIIRSVYLWAIGIIVGGMVVHNLLIMNYFLVLRARQHARSGATIRRFTVAWIVQHAALTLSFVVLAVTGFALRFPEAFWVEWLVSLGMTESLRGNLHRGAAVVLFLTSVLHVGYLLGTKRGRWELRSLAPSRKDWSDLLTSLRFYLFRSEKKARFGRYDYTQKAEYWAVVWGSVLMFVTGLILWLPVHAARFLPTIVIPAAQTIHYYEALLATLVILVWHFFFVIFHPEAYPMSWTWITGRMPREAAQEQHPEWFLEEVSKRDSPTQSLGDGGSFYAEGQDPHSA
jgi:formate dehydrogenase gamma subunit